MTLKHLFYIFLLLACNSSLAQPSSENKAVYDSLLTEIKKYDASIKEKGQTNYIPADTLKGDLLYALFRNSEYLNDPEEGKKLVVELKNISNALHYQKGIANAFTAEGNYLARENQFSAAMVLHKKALIIRQQINDKEGIRWSNYFIGNNYQWQDKLKEATPYYKTSLALSQKANDSILIGRNLVCFGALCESVNNFTDAISYYIKAAIIFEAIGAAKLHLDMLFYQWEMQLTLGNYTEADLLKNKAYPLAKNINSNIIWENYYNYTTLYYQKKEMHDSALVSIKKSIALNKLTGNTNDLPFYYLTFTSVVLRASPAQLNAVHISPIQKIPLLKSYLNKALELGLQGNIPNVQYDAYKYLSTVYELENNMQQSLHYYKLYVSKRDSVINAENSDAVNTLKIQYETEKKEQQIALLNKDKALQQTEIQKQKTTRNAFMGGTALVLLLAGAIYNRYRIKQKANKQIEQTLLHLKNTQEQIVQQGKLAALGKMTNEIATEINVPVNTLKHLLADSRQLFADVKHNGATNTPQMQELKTKLNSIQQQGLIADDVVKRVLKEIRSANG